jgi:hypothetical protein
MDFGKYAVLRSAKHTFEKEPEWWWKIAPVTPPMQIAFGNWANGKNPNWIEIALHEIALSFDGTNIPSFDIKLDSLDVEEKSDLLIDQVLTYMPVEMLEELWLAVGEANPMWGPVNIEYQVANRIEFLVKNVANVSDEERKSLLDAFEKTPAKNE